MPFRDRKQAGELLAQRLLEGEVAGRTSLVLALPREGMPVAAPIARALGAELDVFLVRKLGVPFEEQYAMGAVASGGIRVIDHAVVRALKIDAATIERVTRTEQAELVRHEREYRGTRPFPRIAGRTVIVVDDGLATGASMRAAVQALRTLDPGQLVIAVPVAPRGTCMDLAGMVDRLECLATPHPFPGVGQCYVDSRRTTDDEVIDALAASALREAA